jgi:hypothetical protein
MARTGDIAATDVQRHSAAEPAGPHRATGRSGPSPADGKVVCRLCPPIVALQCVPPMSSSSRVPGVPRIVEARPSRSRANDATTDRARRSSRRSWPAPAISRRARSPHSMPSIRPRSSSTDDSASSIGEPAGGRRRAGSGSRAGMPQVPSGRRWPAADSHAPTARAGPAGAAARVAATAQPGKPH